MAEITLLPLANRAQGSYNFGPVAVPDNISEVLFKFARCTTPTPTVWPSTSMTVEALLEVSTDGVTWGTLVGFKDSGGIIPARAGGESQFTFAAGKFQTGTGRQVRGNITIQDLVLPASQWRSSISVVVT